MAALCIGAASLVTSTTTSRSDATVRVALALAILGTVVNILAILLLGFRGQRESGKLSWHLQRGVTGAGVLMPLFALMCLFVATQPVVTIVTASIVGMYWSSVWQGRSGSIRRGTGAGTRCHDCFRNAITHAYTTRARWM